MIYKHIAMSIMLFCVNSFDLKRYRFKYVIYDCPRISFNYYTAHYDKIYYSLTEKVAK